MNINRIESARGRGLRVTQKRFFHSKRDVCSVPIHRSILLSRLSLGDKTANIQGWQYCSLIRGFQERRLEFRHFFHSFEGGSSSLIIPSKRRKKEIKISRVLNLQNKKNLSFIRSKRRPIKRAIIQGTSKRVQRISNLLNRAMEQLTRPRVALRVCLEEYTEIELRVPGGWQISIFLPPLFPVIFSSLRDFSTIRGEQAVPGDVLFRHYKLFRFEMGQMKLPWRFQRPKYIPPSWIPLPELCPTP